MGKKKSEAALSTPSSPSPDLSASASSDSTITKRSKPKATPASQNGGVSATVSEEEDESLEVVKVNNWSLNELKVACDDAIRRYLSRPEQFKTQHLHTDIRLALGWSSVLIAAATGLYGYKVEFEQSKPVVWAGLILYILLSAVQTLYAYFVEKDIIFVGKRKVFDKRIETERITLSSHTTPSTKTSYPSSSGPTYSLTLSYTRSSNGGKTIIHRDKLVDQQRPYTTFFDSEGTMDEVAFRAWLGGLVGKVIGPVEAK